MKKSTLFAAMVLSLSVLISGVIMPGGAEAYNRQVHGIISIHARELWTDNDVHKFNEFIFAGAKHEDELDHIWYHGGWCTTITHFWNPDNGIGDLMEETDFCQAGNNAGWKAQIFWGMALGQYRTANEYPVDSPSWVTHMGRAYEYLGHLVHLVSDMTVPAHAHKDVHATESDSYDDVFMNEVNDFLMPDDVKYLQDTGLIDIPQRFQNMPVYWLFYTTAQLTGFYASDDVDGNSYDPTTTEDPPTWTDFNLLEDVPTCMDQSTGNIDNCECVTTDDVNSSSNTLCMQRIRRNCYLRAIRASATLFKLFEEQAKKQDELTVVIDEIEYKGGHGDGIGDYPDYFVRVMIGDDFWFRNEGEQTSNTQSTVNPGWAFARDVGRTGSANVAIQLYDDDSSDYEQSDIYSGPDPSGEEKSLWMTVNIETGEIFHPLIFNGLQPIGRCGQQLVHQGSTDPQSKIIFRILCPGSTLPTVDAGPDQAVYTYEPVTLNGSFTDPDVNDTHTFFWKLELQPTDNFQIIDNPTMQSLSFTPMDAGPYVFSFTVTDNNGAKGFDYVVIYAKNPNTPPTAEAGPDQTVNESDTVTLNGTFIDPDAGDTHTFLWHLESSTNGQSIPDFATQTFNFTPIDNGLYVFSFTVTDNEGAQGSDNVKVTAVNMPPVVDAPNIVNQPNSAFILPMVHEVTFKGSFTDSGIMDTHTAAWDWGDGTISIGSVTESNGAGNTTNSHIYSLPGDYEITLTVTDDDGGIGSNTMAIHIAGVGEVLNIFKNYIQSLPDDVFKNNADNRKNVFDNIFNALDNKLAEKAYQGMIQAINNNLRGKFDGLIEGSPNQDWIIQDMAIQTKLCQNVDDITAYLRYLLATKP